MLSRSYSLRAYISSSVFLTILVLKKIAVVSCVSSKRLFRR